MSKNNVPKSILDQSTGSGVRRQVDVDVAAGADVRVEHEVTGHSTCLAAVTIPAGATVACSVQDLPAEGHPGGDDFELQSHAWDNSGGGTPIVKPIRVPHWDGTHVGLDFTSDAALTVTIVSHSA